MPDPEKQRALKAAKKAAAKKVAEPKPGVFSLKRHQRKGQATALAIHCREDKKQLCQLLETVVADAEPKMDELVKDLNSGKMTPEDVIKVVDQLKGKAQERS